MFSVLVYTNSVRVRQAYMCTFCNKLAMGKFPLKKNTQILHINIDNLEEKHIAKHFKYLTYQRIFTYNLAL